MMKKLDNTCFWTTCLPLHLRTFSLSLRHTVLFLQHQGLQHPHVLSWAPASKQTHPASQSFKDPAFAHWWQQVLDLLVSWLMYSCLWVEPCTDWHTCNEKCLRKSLTCWFREEFSDWIVLTRLKGRTWGYNKKESSPHLAISLHPPAF